MNPRSCRGGTPRRRSRRPAGVLPELGTDAGRRDPLRAQRGRIAGRAPLAHLLQRVAPVGRLGVTGPLNCRGHPGRMVVNKLPSGAPLVSLVSVTPCAAAIGP